MGPLLLHLMVLTIRYQTVFHGPLNPVILYSVTGHPVQEVGYTRNGRRHEQSSTNVHQR